MALVNDVNGPFVRSAWAELGTQEAGQVHAMRILFRNGKSQYWNARETPFTDDELATTRASAYRQATKSNPVLSVEPVWRTVFISATPWVEA